MKSGLLKSSLKNEKLCIGVVFTLAELYRKNKPQLPQQFYMKWQPAFDAVLSKLCQPVYAPPACTAKELKDTLHAHNKNGCNAIFLIPMAYTPSRNVLNAMKDISLPVVLISSAADSTLPYNIEGMDLIRNQSMHGIQDIANVLWREKYPFDLIAGHPSNRNFVSEIESVLKTLQGVNVFKTGRAGQIGGWFEGMLDFTFDKKCGPGFKIYDIQPEILIKTAKTAPQNELDQLKEEVERFFEISSDLTQIEFEQSIRYFKAMQIIAEQKQLTSIGLNFKSIVEAGASTLPFLGASALMASGIGYAGEGDILTASLMAAMSRISGEATFTEMFCPDYKRQQILISHMGECNYQMARQDKPVKLMPRPFDWGNCERPAVAIFQLKPGPVTLASLTEMPLENSKSSFRLVAFKGEILDAPDHPFLRNPHSRIKVNDKLEDFLVNYSRAGGTHHLALVYGDCMDKLLRFAELMNFDFSMVTK
jgi:L-arabinose isomerase